MLMAKTDQRRKKIVTKIQINQLYNRFVQMPIDGIVFNWKLTLVRSRYFILQVKLFFQVLKFFPPLQSGSYPISNGEITFAMNKILCSNFFQSISSRFYEVPNWTQINWYKCSLPPSDNLTVFIREFILLECGFMNQIKLQYNIKQQTKKK